MSDQIRIVSIELENYRQYYGKTKISLSSRDEGFTIIAGQNGEGKSNLLNAISWCLYNEEPHGIGDDLKTHVSENRSLSVINNRYITELDDGKMAKTRVEIWIQKGDVTYSISRILQVMKHRLDFKDLPNGAKVMKMTDTNPKVPSGCEVYESNDDFVVKKSGPDERDFHDTRSDAHPSTILETILPQRLSKYFLLDGEFLEAFWKNPITIQKGIEQISQLYLLNSLNIHINDLMLIPPKGAGGGIDEISKRIDVLRWWDKSLEDNGNEKFSEMIRWKSVPNDEDMFYHATGLPRQQELEEDNDKMNDRIKTILSILPNTGPENLKSLKNKFAKSAKELSIQEQEQESIASTYLYNLITKGPYVLLQNAIKQSIKIIEERMTLGDLPVKHRKQFADDLLKRGQCLCGEDLNSTSHEPHITQRRQNIEDFSTNLSGREDLDSAVDIRYSFVHFIEKYGEFVKVNFNDPRRKLTDQITKCKDLKDESQGLRIQIENSEGDGDSSSLLDEHDQLQNQIQKNIKEIEGIKNTLKINYTKTVQLRDKQSDELRKSNKHRKAAHEYDIWRNIDSHLHQVYEELKQEIREYIQTKTWENFTSLLSNSSEFKDFKIESDYSVYLLDHHDINKVRNLSAGQSLILTLAFVTALREPTGYKFPLIIDSPLGKIDSGNRYNIGHRLPEYLPKEQITLLVTDTEYTADLTDPTDPNQPKIPFGKILESKIPLKHFKINKEKKGINTGNSVILPAKLVSDDNNGWVVSSDV